MYNQSALWMMPSLFPCSHQKSTSNDFLECVKNVTNEAFSFEHDQICIIKYEYAEFKSTIYIVKPAS